MVQLLIETLAEPVCIIVEGGQRLASNFRLQVCFRLLKSRLLPIGDISYEGCNT